MGSTNLVSRMNERWRDAGAMPLSSSKIPVTASQPKTSAITVCPIILALLRRPRERCLDTLMKSSRKPTTPIPTNRKISSSADADGVFCVISSARK